MTEVEKVIIRGVGAVSALGRAASGPAYAATGPGFVARTFAPPGWPGPVAAITAEAEAALAVLRTDAALRPLDRAALLAVLAAREAGVNAGWFGEGRVLSDFASPPIAVGIGSSRGATGRLEEAFAGFQEVGRTAPTTSPLTTPGNLAAAVAHDLEAQGAAVGAAVSHSSTCSSALQALGTGLAWLKAGLADRYLAGGTEAPLTPFTVAQLRAVGIYSGLAANDYPCRPGQVAVQAGNTFVLGEGAAVFALERAVPQPGDLVLASVGFGFERAASRTGITPDGQHFQRAMQQALKLAGRTAQEVDTLILHAPGTLAGDNAELAAAQAVFSEHLPELLSNKWLLGHTLGAAGALSVDFARWLLLNPTAPAPAPPYASRLSPSATPVKPRRCVMVNAAGFGGNAACALVELA
jgi:3-oxoacyl-[acyl-carrier-protein] synthase II